MAEPIVEEEEKPPCEEQEKQLKMEGAEALSRKEKRKALKKNKRKLVRKETALKEREADESRLNDPEEQARLELLEKEEAERIERDRKEFEDRERAWLEALEMKKKKMEAGAREEEERRKALEDSNKQQVEKESDCEDDGDWEFLEGPPEIIWQGNEIIVKKKRVRVPKKDCEKEDNSRPTSNPLPPQTEAFADYNNASKVSAKQMLENVAQQVPNFGTELDKAHCPFHLKTGACRFGQRCSRAHFYPDKSCTLLIKNMYNGPGITWEQDEGLEHTDEEVERCFEEFYEDVHTEFLKFGEIVNFKVCRNGAFHLRGNVYVHYKSLDSAVLAYQSINARYFAGKQISCEFVNVTKWKAAICGDYMKSRFKTCSHGTACNFIHCFRNPGGDYEWADWDKHPPRYWIKKMVALFGYSDESGYENQMEQEHPRQPSSSRMMTPDVDRHYSKRSRYKEMGRSKNISSGGSWGNENDTKTSSGVRGRIKDDDEKIYSDGDRSDRDTDKDRVRNKDRHQSRDRKSSRHRQKVSRSLNVDERSKKETYENDSSGEWSDRSRDRESHHGHTRKGSRKRSRTHQTDYDEDRSDRDRDRNRDRENDKDRHLAHGRKRSRQRKEISRSPNDCNYRKKRTEESDSSGGDWSGRDGDRETSHGRTRKGSRNRGQGGYPDGKRRTEWDRLVDDREEETHHSHEVKH